MWQNEEEIKQRIPPSKLQKVTDDLVEMSLQEIMARFEERRTRHHHNLSFSQVGSDKDDDVVPEEIHKEIISKMMSMLENGQKPVATQRRVIEEIAVWKSEQLRTAAFF